MAMKIKGWLGLFWLPAILFPIYILLYKIYIPKVNAFGCFDDCFNFVAGYFLTKGKILYSEIFFNHQPLMAFTSFFIQTLTHPINIYDLVLKHRQFVFLFGFLSNLLLVWRFRWPGLGFVFFYEFSKFYLFGDRFLAEGVIVYPLVYLVGLIWSKFQERKVYSWEYLLSGFFSWFIVFMREPYIPLVLFIDVLILWGRPDRRIKTISFLIFVTLTVSLLAFLPVREYYFNLVTVNLKTVVAHEMGLGIDMVKSFFYPLYLVGAGKWGFFRYFLVGLDAAFLVLFSRLFFLKRAKLAFMIIFLLGLANLRPMEPGTVFYEAFHLLSWYALFIFFIFLMLFEADVLKKKLSFLVLVFLISLFGCLVFSHQSYIYDRIDPQTEFMTNFGNELQVGEVIRALSKPTDTLFLDGFDDLIYWQAGRLSPYPYSWYTSVMPKIPKYAQARLEMFTNSPPDFYYGACPNKEVPQWTMPAEFKKNYQALYSGGKPTCLYIRKDKIPQISKEGWQKAKEFLYELPSRVEVENNRENIKNDKNS